MFKLLGGLKVYFKVQEIQTDNAVFRLHNVFTTVLLLSSSLVITATQYVGQPISCIVSGIPAHVVNTFCWVASTFTMPDAFNRQIGRDVAHHGIANDFNDESAKKYYTYYQWVCFVLFFQAIACYVPKFLWDSFEGGLMSQLVMGLKLGICGEEEKTAKKTVILNYLNKYMKRHKMYAVRYWCCEALCLVNILVQMWLMNWFFDGEFLSYGMKVMNFVDETQEERVDPMVFVFPRMTKCNFHKYGPSGSIQKHDALCILPLNMVNEKTYIFIWFWYMIMVVMFIGLFIYRACIITMPKLRARILNARNRMVPRDVAYDISHSVDIGDWWLLYMLGRNLDPFIFRDVMCDLVKDIDVKKRAQR